MHPVVILVPAAVLIFGPRLWVKYVLDQHDHRDETLSGTAGEVAREILDRHQLHAVKVESTDVGDHYDPLAKAVRISRDKFGRRSLTAVTTAAHEVAHALQDASGYGPFVWRGHLVKVAQVTGEVGSIMLLSVPVASLVTHEPVSPLLIRTAIFTMLGAGVAAQLAALPSEIDASFGRALPLLRERYITAGQATDARKILFACSLTYVASSLVAVLNFWPWLGRRPVIPPPPSPRSLAPMVQTPDRILGRTTRSIDQIGIRTRRPRNRKQPSIVHELVRQIGKPLIRGWLRLSRAW